MLVVRITAVGTLALLIALLPLTLILGPVGLLAWGAAAAWYGHLGVRLWRQDPRVVRAATATYRATLLFGGFGIVHGVLALRAAERSAASGGGLLGAYGLIPILAGCLLAAMALLSLRAVAAVAATRAERSP